MALTPNTRLLQLNRVRLLVQEPTVQYWTDAVLNLYINEAQFDIAIGCVPGTPSGQEEPILATESTTPSVTDQELYSMPGNYHAARVVRARSSSTDTYSELPIVDIEYVRAHPTGTAGTGTSSQPKPTAFFLWGESGTYQIGVYPPFNSANGLLYVSYWRLPDEMTADGAGLQIPAELHVANTYLAAYKAWFERGHVTEADKALQTFVHEYQAKIAYIRRRQLNQKRAKMVGHIGDDDTDSVLF